MSEEKIENLLRDAARWEPQTDAPSGLASAALARRRRGAWLPPLTVATAFAAGFCAIAVIRAPATKTAGGAGAALPPVAIASPVPPVDRNTGTPDGMVNAVAAAPAGRPDPKVSTKPTGNKPVEQPRRKPMRSAPRIRSTPRQIRRENPLVPRYQLAKKETRFVPVDEPRVVPGIIAQPSAEAGQVKFVPAAVALDDSDVVLADFRSE